jgi:hypothetical protein
MTSFQRQSGIVKEIAQMVREHVFRTTLRDIPDPQLREMLSSVKNHKTIEIFRDGKEFAWFDLLDLVDFCGIDLGITIRMRDGEEVTFYPGHNFGETGTCAGTPQEEKVAKKPYEHRSIGASAAQSAINRYGGGQYAGGMPRRGPVNVPGPPGGPAAWGLNDGEDDDDDCPSIEGEVVAGEMAAILRAALHEEGETLPEGEAEAEDVSGPAIATGWPDCGLDAYGRPRE